MTDRSRTTGDDGSQTTNGRGTQTTGDGRSADASAEGLGRREFVAIGAGASATLLAGCAGDASLPSSGGSDGSDGSDGSQTLTGNFRLLISDAPADIDDFDRLDVTLDRARVFEAGDGGDEEGEADEADEEDTDGDGPDQNATETDEDDESLTGTADEDANETDDEDANETDADDEDDEGEAEADDEEDDEGEAEADGEEDDEDGEDDEDRGFTVVDLGGATVDLTQVIDEDAIAVFDGEIPAGSYEKIELEVSAVEGVVDGETVDVKLPSEKLQITNGFEVAPDEAVSFVFDINVVKRGKNNGYILKPVISGSGVAGRDVDVNEIDDEDDENDEDDEDEESEADEDDSEEADPTGGNETDDAENGTAGGS